MDNLAITPNFNVYKKVQFNHGLFVSKSGVVAETFFHHVEPSKTISVHLNPILEQGTVVERSEEVRNRVCFFGRLKSYIWDRGMGIKKSLKPCTGSFLLHLMSIVLASCIYLGEASEDQAMDGKWMKKIKKLGRNKWGDSDQKNNWFPNVRGKGLSNMFLNGKWSLLTVALALYASGLNY